MKPPISKDPAHGEPRGVGNHRPCHDICGRGNRVAGAAGQEMLHARVVAIETGPGYECRTQDRMAGAKISAHGQGLAVDFVAIAFADKRRILVERQTGADEASYFRALRTAACGWFTTVLGPGSDAFHATNMHLDVEPHGSSGIYNI
jgi:hypothetical protein